MHIVDIEFDVKNATPGQKIYNEIYPSIIEKQKIIDPCERSVYQLLEQYADGENNKPLPYCVTAKAHATMLQKRFFPMCLEQLAFVIKTAFEQKPFKKIILMNQKLRQNFKNNIEKGFYKLMNSSNFGYGCRNN